MRQMMGLTRDQDALIRLVTKHRASLAPILREAFQRHVEVGRLNSGVRAGVIGDLIRLRADELDPFFRDVVEEFLQIPHSTMIGGDERMQNVITNFLAHFADGAPKLKEVVERAMVVGVALPTIGRTVLMHAVNDAIETLEAEIAKLSPAPPPVDPTPPDAET
jgi:hypothetical protein